MPVQMMTSREIVPANANLKTPFQSGGPTAAHPFNDPRADMILRSSDGIEFRVSRCILALSSPSIERSFVEREKTRSVTPYSERNAISSFILPECESMPEESETLDSLLRIIYPVSSPDMDSRDLDHLFKVLEAAMKYGMDKAIIYMRKTLQGRFPLISDNRIIEQRCKKDPSESDIVSFFALSSHFHFETEARSAARAFLRIPNSDRRIYSKYLSHISGASYFHLLNYRQRVTNIMKTIFFSLDFYKNVLNASVFRSEAQCSHANDCEEAKTEVYSAASGEECNQYTCGWWVRMRDDIVSKLEDIPLRQDILKISEVTDCVDSCKCYQCKKIVFTSWDKFRELTYAHISKEIDKVELILPWMTESSGYSSEQILHNLHP